MKKYSKYFVGGAGILLIFSGGASVDWSVLNTWRYVVEMPFLAILQVFGGIVLLIIAARMGGEDSST